MSVFRVDSAPVVSPETVNVSLGWVAKSSESEPKMFFDLIEAGEEPLVGRFSVMIS